MVISRAPSRELTVLPNRTLKIPKARWSTNVCARLPSHRDPVLADFSTSQSWFNGLSMDIYIKSRDGTIACIPGQVGMERTGSLICLTANERGKYADFDHELQMDYGTLMDNAPMSMHAQKEALLTTKTQLPSGTTVRPKSKAIRSVSNISDTLVKSGCRYTFEESEFRDSAVYLSDLDVVICRHREDAINTIHPQSHLGLILTDGNVNLNDRLSFSMLLIDNEAKYTDRYTTIHEMHFRIPKIIDGTRPDGIYILRSGNADENQQHLNIIHKYHTVEESDRLNITRTQREYESSDRKALNESLEQIKIMQDIINKSDDRVNRNAELERKVEEERQKRIDAEHLRTAAEARFDREMSERIKAREEATRVNRRKDYIEYVKLGLSAVGVLVSLGVKFKKA